MYFYQLWYIYNLLENRNRSFYSIKCSKCFILTKSGVLSPLVAVGVDSGPQTLWGCKCVIIIHHRLTLYYPNSDFGFISHAFGSIWSYLSYTIGTHCSCPTTKPLLNLSVYALSMKMNFGKIWESFLFIEVWNWI